jgi:hypothetical protein
VLQNGADHHSERELPRPVAVQMRFPAILSASTQVVLRSCTAPHSRGYPLRFRIARWTSPTSNLPRVAT